MLVTRWKSQTLEKRESLSLNLLMLSCRFLNCIQHDVTAQHLGLMSRWEKSRLLVLGPFLKPFKNKDNFFVIIILPGGQIVIMFKCICNFFYMWHHYGLYCSHLQSLFNHICIWTTSYWMNTHYIFQINFSLHVAPRLASTI